MKEDNKYKVFKAILTDNLGQARTLLREQPDGLELLAELLELVWSKAYPFKQLKAKEPEFIGINPSFTCGIGCEMCNSGFSDKSVLFEDKKYLLPQEFNNSMQWIKAASNVIFVGLGETLNSPYITQFIETVQDKNSFLYTSGIPLNQEKASALIKSGLKHLIFSFDGKSRAGHSGGNEEYIQKFWEKVRLVRKVKLDQNSLLPELKLIIAVDSENINELNELIDRAAQNSINEIMLAPMTPSNKNLYYKSIFKNYEESKEIINTAILYWMKRGVRVTLLGQFDSIQDTTENCPYVDNWLSFYASDDTPSICCGEIALPLSPAGLNIDEFWNSFPFRYFRHLHFRSQPNELPNACKNCWAMNLKQYSHHCSTLYNDEKTEKMQFDALTTYHSASEFKKKNFEEKSEKMFLRILSFSIDPELKGKACFHLGELQLRNKNYIMALSYMKRAIQNYFKHGHAFSYLYLLIMLTEEETGAEKKTKFNLMSRVNKSPNF